MSLWSILGELGYSEIWVAVVIMRGRIKHKVKYTLSNIYYLSMLLVPLPIPLLSPTTQL